MDSAKPSSVRDYEEKDAQEMKEAPPEDKEVPNQVVKLEQGYQIEECARCVQDPTDDQKDDPNMGERFYKRLKGDYDQPSHGDIDHRGQENIPFEPKPFH